MIAHALLVVLPGGRLDGIDVLRHVVAEGMEHVAEGGKVSTTG